MKFKKYLNESLLNQNNVTDLYLSVLQTLPASSKRELSNVISTVDISDKDWKRKKEVVWWNILYGILKTKQYYQLV